MINIYKYFFIIFLINLKIIQCENSFLLRGMAWSSIIANNSLTEFQFGYIPNLSANLINKSIHQIDFEMSYKLNYLYNKDSLAVPHSLEPYRFWIRYSSDLFEARLGLQKISFGPSQIFRPLNWFDTLDYRDPTGQTEGVEAIRLRYFANTSLGIWAWIISEPKSSILQSFFSNKDYSSGGRLEFSSHYGELGITTDIKNIDFKNSNKASHFGLDYRYDGYIGFWFESSWLESKSMYSNSNYSNNIIAIGNDYTLPIGPGIYLLTETMYLSQTNTILEIPEEYEIQLYTSFMAQLPLGIFQQIMLVSTINWDTGKIAHYLQWGSTYDQFIINFITSTMPDNQYNQLQFMIIYNH